MINLIKADIYRIFRGKGIYITIGFLLGLCSLQAFGGIDSLGVSSSSMEGIDEVIPLVTGRIAPLIMMRTNDNLLYLLLPIIIIISSVDFSSGTAKNVLVNGVSRSKYYLSKLVLTMLFCIILLVFSIVIPTIIISLLNGFGGEFDGEFIGQVLKAFSLQLLLFLAVTSIGIFFVFTTKSTAKVNGIYIAFCLVPMIIIVLLFNISEKFLKLLDYEVVMNIRMAANANSMSSGEIGRMILVGIVYLVLSLVGGLILFRKCDIK
ncbi:ABC transporter permease subunit [Mycoplasmatota bacterium zrk1]